MELDATAGRVYLDIEQIEEKDSGLANAVIGTLIVEVRTEGGRSLHKLAFTSRKQRLEIPCTNLPIWVRLDPEGVFPGELREQRGEREWLALAEAGTSEEAERNLPLDITARLSALEYFVADKAEVPEGLKEARVQVVRRLTQTDPNPVVQTKALQALVELSGDDAREALRYLARSSQHAGASGCLAGDGELPPVEVTAGFAKVDLRSWVLVADDGGRAWAVAARRSRWGVAGGADREHHRRRAGPVRPCFGGGDPGCARGSPGAVVARAGPRGTRWHVLAAGSPCGPWRVHRQPRSAPGLIGALASPYQDVVSRAIGSLCKGQTPAIRSALVDHYRTCLDARHKRQIEGAVAGMNPAK
ncbi:MAG: hypothetical protein R3E96_15300 [Planctomycetota bacterium]